MNSCIESVQTTKSTPLMYPVYHAHSLRIFVELALQAALITVFLVQVRWAMISWLSNQVTTSPYSRDEPVDSVLQVLRLHGFFAIRQHLPRCSWWMVKQLGTIFSFVHWSMNVPGSATLVHCWNLIQPSVWRSYWSEILSNCGYFQYSGCMRGSEGRSQRHTVLRCGGACARVLWKLGVWKLGIPGPDILLFHSARCFCGS